MRIESRLALSALCALTIASSSRAAADEAAIERYAVIQDGEKIGYVVAARRGSHVEIDFRIDDNGRGPKLKEQLTLDEHGRPTAWRIEGKAEAGAPVKEEFAFAAGRATWKSLDDSGSASAAAPLYVAKDTSSWALGMYVRAALAAPDGVVRSLPSGELRAAKLREVRTGGPAGAQATAYALYGVDMKPLIVLLDGNRRLFAFVSPVQVTVAEAHAGAWPALRDLAVELDHELLARLAREATHRPAGPVYVKNVHVFDSVTGRRSDPTTIVVYGSRVVGVRPDATAPANAAVIDGEGGTVLPGLHDMHAHMDAWDGAYHLAAGVTSVRDPGNVNRS